MGHTFYGLSSNSVLANAQTAERSQPRLHPNGIEALSTLGAASNTAHLTGLAPTNLKQPSTVLSSAQAYAHQQVTFTALVAFLTKKISPTINATSTTTDSTSLLAEIDDSLAQLGRHLIDTPRSPYSIAEQQEPSFQALIARCSPAGPLYTHISQSFDEASLKSFAQLFKLYTQKILQTTAVSAQNAIKRALLIFPPDDDQYHCTGGTINRLIIAQQSLDTGPQQLLLTLFQEAQQQVYLIAQQHLDEGHEIHLPPALLFLLTGDAKHVETIDPLFRSPFEAISSASAWQAYRDLNQAIPNVHRTVAHIVQSIEDVQMIKLAEAALVFTPWQLIPWDQDGVSNYPTTDQLECALFQQLNSTLWPEQTAIGVPWQSMPATPVELPEYAALQGTAGRSWLIRQLRPQQSTSNLYMPKQALHALFLMTESLKDNNPAQGLAVLHGLAQNRSIQAGLALLELQFPDQASQPVLQRIKDRVEFYCRTSYLSQSRPDRRLIRLYQMLQGDVVDFKSIWIDHFSCTARAINPEEPTLCKVLVNNNCVAALQALNDFRQSDYGRPEEIKSAIHAAINASDSDGMTPMHLAAKLGHAEVINTLINSGADVNKPAAGGETPIHIAAERGCVAAIKALITPGIDINKQADDNTTPLYTAAYFGRVDAIKTLIDNGADTNQPSFDGATPLHVAADRGYVEVIKALISPRTDINKQTDDGITPLYVAAYFGHIETTKLLIENDADANQSAIGGATPLHVAAERGYDEVIQALTSFKTDLNKQADDGTTPLSTAAYYGQVNTVKTLVACGADVNGAVENGATPMHIAVERGYCEVINTLIDLKCDVNKLADGGISPLHVAAEFGHIDVIKILLNNSASIDMTKFSGDM